MGLTRLLLLGLLIGAIWIIYKRIKRFLLIQRENPGNHPPAQVTMVRCRYCGMHIPEHEAVIRQERIYCSIEHANKG